MIEIGMKICQRCNKNNRKRKRIGVWHPVSNFTRDSKNDDGYRYACKSCISGAIVKYLDDLSGKPQPLNLMGILNQATKKLTSTQKGYYTHEY